MLWVLSIIRHGCPLHQGVQLANLHHRPGCSLSEQQEPLLGEQAPVPCHLDAAIIDTSLAGGRQCCLFELP